MTPKTHRTVISLMHSYKRTGSKVYRKKQVSRLMSMLNNIFEHEQIQTNELQQLGRKQMIGFWRRHEHLSEKTRKEYWLISHLLFEQLGKRSPPKPNKSKETVT